MASRDNSKTHNLVAHNSSQSLLELIQVDQFEVVDFFERLKLSEQSCGILALFGFICSSVIYETTYSDNPTPEKQLLIDLTFFLCIFSTAILLCSITWRSYLSFGWKRCRGQYPMHLTLFSSGNYKWLCLELLVNSLTPLKALEGSSFSHYNETLGVSQPYSYNAVLSLCTLFRMYFLIRYAITATTYRSSRAQRISNMNGISASSWFAVKCLMKDEALKLVICMMLLSILAGGYAIRIFERPFSEDSGMDFNDYSNAMWLVVLTMTTVGYGDYFPVTLFGRLVGFIVCIWGVLVVSIMVVTLSNTLQLEPGEQNALTLFKRLEFKEELRLRAAIVICSVFRYKVLRRKSPDDSKVLKEQLGIVKSNLNAFRQLKLQQRSLYNLDSANDRIEREIKSVIQGSESANEFVDRTIEKLRGIR